MFGIPGVPMRRFAGCQALEGAMVAGGIAQTRADCICRSIRRDHSDWSDVATPLPPPMHACADRPPHCEESLARRVPVFRMDIVSHSHSYSIPTNTYRGDIFIEFFCVLMRVACVPPPRTVSVASVVHAVAAGIRDESAVSPRHVNASIAKRGI